MNAKVFTTVSDDKSTIYVYCFYQQDKEKGDHLNQHACQCFTILTQGFELKKGKLYADVIGDILFQNNKVKEIYPHSQRKMNVNIFRYQQALDDSSLLFWRPHAIKGLASEFPAIFFLRLIEGKVLVDMELMPSPLQRVNTDKVAICISVLEIVNNAYLYAQVQQDPFTHQATFERRTKFNSLKYQPIPSDEDCWDIQLIVNFDKDNFPFFVALNCLLSQIFLVHTLTRQRIVLVNVKKLHQNDKIHEIYQDATYNKTSIINGKKNYRDLEEIVISFKLKLVNHDGKDESITYCPLIIPKVAISMLIESKGSLPNTFKEALDHIRYREEIIQQQEKEKNEIQRQLEEQLQLALAERNANRDQLVQQNGCCCIIF